MGKFNDLTGQTFGKWLVIERAGKNKAGGRFYYLCKCLKCGCQTVKRGHYLKAAEYESCSECYKLQRNLQLEGSGPVWDIRTKLQLTRPQLATRLGCTESTIGYAERNGRLFGHERLTRALYRIDRESIELVEVIEKLICVQCKDVFNRPRWRKPSKSGLKFCGRPCSAKYFGAKRSIVSEQVFITAPEPTKRERRNLWEGMEQTLKESKE